MDAVSLLAGDYFPEPKYFSFSFEEFDQEKEKRDVEEEARIFVSSPAGWFGFYYKVEPSLPLYAISRY